MSRLNDIARLAGTIDCHLNSTRPIGRGDSGCYARRRFYRNGKVCAVRRVVLINHERQLKKFAALARERQTNEAARIGRHKIDIGRSDAFGRDNQVAFVLAIFVVHKDDHFALANVFDDFFDCIQFHDVGIISLELIVNSH